MSIYETKTVRIHLRERGRYVYLMLTRFNGGDHLLGDEGWKGDYIHYSLISRTPQRQDAATGDPFVFIRENEWLQETPADDFVKALEMEWIEWSDFEDEDHLTPEDVAQLTDRGNDDGDGEEVEA